MGAAVRPDPTEPFELFVNGTLMRRLPLHANLMGAEFLGEVRTAPCYRLYSIADSHPGMFEVASDGVSVQGELYRVPPTVWRQVAAGEPDGLYLGTGAGSRMGGWRQESFIRARVRKDGTVTYRPLAVAGLSDDPRHWQRSMRRRDLLLVKSLSRPLEALGDGIMLMSLPGVTETRRRRHGPM